MKRSNQNRPSPILGRMALEATKPGFSFFVFILCCNYICFDWWMCAFVLLGLVFAYQANRLAWETSPKLPVLCRVGYKTTTQSIIVQCSPCHIAFQTISLTDFTACRWYWLWSPYVIGQTIIFLPCGFYLLSSFFSSPNLSGQRVDVYHTSTHGVALVRI